MFWCDFAMSKVSWFIVCNNAAVHKAEVVSIYVQANLSA